MINTLSALTCELVDENSNSPVSDVRAENFYFQVKFIDCYLREIISFTKKNDIRDLGQSRCEDCYVILKSRLKYVWCCENFNIRYGEMVLERLQSIFCISSVTKQNGLHYPTLRMKVSLEINLGCLIHPL